MNKQITSHLQLPSIGRHYYLIILLFILVLMSLSSTVFKFGFFILISFFPLMPLFYIDRRNLVATLFIFVPLNLLFVVSVAAILNMLAVAITVTSVTFFVTLFALLVFIGKKLKLLSPFTVPVVDYRILTPLLFLFGFAVFSRVYSVFFAPVPIVHDPQAHAFWALQILNGGIIDYFYSPGLHLLIAFSNFATEINVARLTNIITNTLSASTVLIWPLIVYFVSKNKILTLFTCFLFFITPIPTMLYYTAGKNALIAAIAFAPLAIYFLLEYSKNKTTTNIAFLLIANVGVALLHYPTFAFILMLEVLLVLAFSLKKVNQEEQCWRAYFKKLIRNTWPLLVSVLIILLIAGITYSREENFKSIKSNQAAAELHALDSDERAFYLEGATNNQQIYQTVDIRPPTKAATLSFNKIGDLTSKVSPVLGWVLLGLLIPAAYMIFGTIWKKFKDLDARTMLTFCLLITVPIVMIMLYTIHFPAANLVPDAGKFLIFVFGLTPIAFLFEKINSFSYRHLCLFLLTLSVPLMFNTYNVFSQQSDGSYVNSYDLKAYEWINENISDQDKFIGYAEINSSRSKIIFPVDGSLWLPVLTENDIANPYEETRFSSFKTHINYLLVQDLEKDATARNAAKELYSDGYRYIYVDGEEAHKALSIDDLIEKRLASIVYRNREVKIVELDP